MTRGWEDYAAIPPAEFTRRWRTLPTPELRNEALRLRFRGDQAGFLRFFWPDVFVRPFASMHTEILTRHKVGWRERQGSQARTYRALAAPRSMSKTGITIATLVHDAVYGLERVVPILSAELGLSRTSLATIRAMLSEPRLSAVYGPVSFVGGTDRYTVTVGQHACTFIAKSFGTSVRGLKEGMIRPTRLVVDDGEDKLHVNNPDSRRKWWDFLVSDILKLGDISGGLIVDWIGTVLHVDSVLARLLKDGGWRSQRYQACEAWPERTDLWADCGRVWADLSLGDLDTRRAAALTFYGQHREEMDRGARMLNAAWITLFAFFEAIWGEGLSSVLKELQNTPRDPSASLFDSSKFPRCRVERDARGDLVIIRPDGKRIRRAELRSVTMRLDPIPGEQMGGLAGGPGGSDFAAIAVIAVDSVGFAYVVDLWMKRAKMSEQLAALWSLGEKWQATRAIIEANGFAVMIGPEFRREQAERREKRLYWQLPVAGEASTTNKEGDIAALEPVLASGWLFFAEHLPAEGLAQFDDFPTGTHDDGADAIARGYRDAKRMVQAGMVDEFRRG